MIHEHADIGAVVMWRYSREIADVLATVCRHSLTSTTLVPSSNCFYGRPCVSMEGRYILHVFFSNVLLEGHGTKLNQNLPYVYGREPDLNTDIQKLGVSFP